MGNLWNWPWWKVDNPNSTNGAFRFSVLRSITDTVLKNKLNILESLGFIANFETD